MEATAYIKYVKISPKKVKSLAKLTVGWPVTSALERLKFTPGKSSILLLKAILSARANAVNNLKLDEKNLIVSAISIEKGPFLKRWQPVARGTAHAYKKRSSHLKIKVAEKTAKITEKKAELSAENKTAESKPAAKIKEKGRGKKKR